MPLSGIRSVMLFNFRNSGVSFAGAQPLALSPYNLPVFVSYTMAKRSPPIPFIIGSTTPITAFVATAASMALPPRAKIVAPACAASGLSAATIPSRVNTIERPCVRSCPRAGATTIGNTVIAATTKANTAAPFHLAPSRTTPPRPCITLIAQKASARPTVAQALLPVRLSYSYRKRSCHQHHLATLNTHLLLGSRLRRHPTTSPVISHQQPVMLPHMLRIPIPILKHLNHPRIPLLLRQRRPILN